MPTAVQQTTQPQGKSESQVHSAAEWTTQEAVEGVPIESSLVDAGTLCTLNKLNIVLICILCLLSLPPAARLPYCLHNWRAIISDQPLDFTSGSGLLTGVNIHSILDRCTMSTNQPTLTSSGRGGTEAVNKRCHTDGGAFLGQFLSRLFLINEKDGSFWPVVNLKPLNQYIVKAHFKMEGINMLKDLLLEKDWMASIDLKDVYHSVAVKAKHSPPFCVRRTDI